MQIFKSFLEEHAPRPSRINCVSHFASTKPSTLGALSYEEISVNDPHYFAANFSNTGVWESKAMRPLSLNITNCTK